MCSSLHQPKLQRLHPWMCHQHAEKPQNRWKQQRLTLFCKIIIIIDNFYIALFSGVPKLTALMIVRGLTPAIPANEFLTPVNSKRLIKPRNPTDFKTTNIVIDHARNNSHSYRLDPSKLLSIDILSFPGLLSTGTT